MYVPEQTEYIKTLIIFVYNLFFNPHVCCCIQVHIPLAQSAWCLVFKIDHKICIVFLLFVLHWFLIFTYNESSHLKVYIPLCSNTVCCFLKKLWRHVILGLYTVLLYLCINPWFEQDIPAPNVLKKSTRSVQELRRTQMFSGCIVATCWDPASHL